MANYTQLQPSDIQSIADYYNLTVIKFEAIEGGARNSSYLLYTLQRKYVLTVCDDDLLSDAIKLGKLLLLLEKCRFTTTRLLAPSKSDKIMVYQDKPIMLKIYIEGHVCENLDDTMLVKIGSEMAKLHQISAPDYLPKQHAYGQHTFSTIIGLNINRNYESWLAKQHQYFKHNIPSDLPCSLIHGDLFYDNILVENNQFKAIIDFEEACYYYRGFDLGMAIVGLCTQKTLVALDKTRALIAGYQQIQKLQQQEKATLQIFIQYAATATSYWRFWKYHIHIPSEDNADKHWQMMQIAKNIKRISKTEFWTKVFQPN